MCCSSWGKSLRQKPTQHFPKLQAPPPTRQHPQIHLAPVSHLSPLSSLSPFSPLSSIFNKRILHLLDRTLKLIYFQAFVVVGGRSPPSSTLDSVLTLLPGTTAWAPLASLPRTLRIAQASVVGGRLRVNGGLSGGSFRSEVIIEKC